MSGSNSSAPGSALTRNLPVDAVQEMAGSSPDFRASSGGGRRGGGLGSAIELSVHSMPSPDAAQEPQRTRIGRLKMLLVLLVCASPVIASYFTYFIIKPSGRANYAELIEPQRPLPQDLPLRDLDGHAVDAAQLKGQWLLVTVDGGACDSACEQRLYVQRQLREMLGRDRDRVEKVWFVEDDMPLRPQLREVLAQSPATKALRVPREALARWLAPAPGHQLEQHLYIVDPMGHWMMRAPVDPDPAKLKRDLERLLRASSSWDRPGR